MTDREMLQAAHEAISDIRERGFDCWLPTEKTWWSKKHEIAIEQATDPERYPELAHFG